MSESYTVTAGSDDRLGAHADESGVNFAVFSAHAERIELCLFDETGQKEVARLALPEKSGDIWHGHVAGLTPGALYGYRAHGPYAPQEGHRFNPNKLLLDPYTTALHGGFRLGRRLLGYNAKAKDRDLTFNRLDSAACMPKSVVGAPLEPYPQHNRPRTDWTATIIYEAHVKGLTMELPGVPDELRGTYDALGCDAVLDHLTALGVTALELLPIHALMTGGFLVERKLTNYWGYNSIAFFAPEPRYFGPNGAAGLRRAVERLHGAGIEVFLDVVYNHTAEGNQEGPTLCFKGLDNASYYTLLHDNPRYYANDAGTGNTVNVRHPRVLQLVIDSLRYWVTAFGIDGFRFDLATTLGREEGGFDPCGGFFDALRQDPLLKSVKLIAEPWDVGPGGYQAGGFPHPFAEWNDAFRDSTRRFWKGEASAAAIAQSILGTAQKFDHSGRPSWAAVNFVAAHDGFTLADVTAYNEKHNEANGENNADGHNGNYSDNLGVEGPTDDAVINQRRSLRRRNMLATLFLSQGTPMLLAGDEIGNSQSGNNNAYCQDNPLGWVNWGTADEELRAFTQKLVAFRKAHPVLTQKPFLHGKTSPADNKPDVTWATMEGAPPHWDDGGFRAFVLTIAIAGDAPDYAQCGERLIVVVNGGDRDAVFTLAEPAEGMGWERSIDTADPAPDAPPVVYGGFPLILADSVVVFSPVKAEGSGGG